MTATLEFDHEVECYAKVIQSHLMHGDMKAGEEIGIRIDQTLNQDATGTLVMLELKSMGLDRVKTEISVQYVDHNIVQADYKKITDPRSLPSTTRALPTPTTRLSTAGCSCRRCRAKRHGEW